MASPSTLPADFTGWDAPDKPKTLPADFDGWDAPAKAATSVKAAGIPPLLARDTPPKTLPADYMHFDAPATPPPGPGISAGEEPSILDRIKGVVIGSPTTGDTAIGRALGYNFEGPATPHVDTTDLPILKPTSVAPEHPTSVAGGVAKGAAKLAEGFTTAPNALMLAGSGGIGLLEKVSPLLPRAISAVFGVDMLKGLYNKAPEVKAAVDSGDPAKIAEAVTETLGTAGMAALALTHAVKGGAAPTVEPSHPLEDLGFKPTESAPAAESPAPPERSVIQPKPAPPEAAGEPLMDAAAGALLGRIQNKHDIVPVATAIAKLDGRDHLKGADVAEAAAIHAGGGLDELVKSGDDEDIKARAAQIQEALGQSKVAVEPADSYQQAVEIVKESGKGSTSQLQRKLGIPYDKAEALLAKMETDGIVGPKDGSKPRQIAGSASKESLPTEARPERSQSAADTPVATEGEAKPEEPKQYDYSSTQVNLPKESADKVLAAAAKIPDSVLTEDGRETQPHVTVKYGLHGNDSAEVEKLLADEGPVTALVKGISIFPAKDADGADVVKLDIDSADLRRLNKKISDALPHTDTHPDYTPHITLAYVKPGEGKKFAGKIAEGISGKKITFDSLAFSGKDGKQTDIKLGGSPKSNVALTPQQAFRMKGPELKALAEGGDTGAQAEIDYRKAKRDGKTVSRDDFFNAGVAPKVAVAPSVKPAESKPEEIQFEKRGDFYQLYGDQAHKVADALGVTRQTERDGRPMVGLPSYRIAQDIETLKGKGFQVKSLEEKPAATQKAVKDLKAIQAQDAAKRLRTAADGLTKQIDSKRNSGVSQQNPTARRNRIASGMANEADRLERIQKGLNRLAELHESGEVPPVLSKIRSRTTFEGVMPRYSEQGKSVADRFPSAFLRPGAARDILEKIKGYPGLKEGRRILENVQYVQDGSRLGQKQIAPVEEAMDAAVKRGWNDRFIREDLARAKRLYSADINEENYQQAVDAVEQLGVKKREQTKEEKIAAAERDLAVNTKIEGYFPTPKPLAKRMVEMADIQPGQSVLEPSAGSGNIADAVREAGSDNLKVIEPVSTLSDILKEKGHDVVPESDFLKHDQKYDRIVMNPPFERGQDMDHVQHAYELLKPGGKLVAIMSEGSFGRSDKKATAFREWLGKVDGTDEKLPDGSFTGKDSMRQTGVAARLVEIDKPGSQSNVAVEYRGKTTTVYTPNETPAKVQYRVMDAADLRTSFDEGYPQELQPRNTDRKGSRERIEAIRNKPNPEKLGANVNAGDGAPIILKDGSVVIGNHRVEAIRDFPSAQAGQYKAWLKENAAGFGLDQTHVDSIKKPVLVREFVDVPKDLVGFARDANGSTTARMSDAEKATQLAKQITPAVMESFDPKEDGTPNAEFIRAALAGMTKEERAEYQDSDGKVSQSGIRAVKNAVFAKAYPDTSAIERMAESTDDNARNISAGLLAAAPRVIEMKAAIDRGDLHDLNIGDELAAAVNVISHLRDEKTSVADWLKQDNMLGRDAVVDHLVDSIAEFSRSSKRVGEFIKEYTKAVDRFGNPKQEGLFGPSKDPNRLELIDGARESVRETIRAERQASKTGELFPEEPTGSGASGEELPSIPEGSSAGDKSDTVARLEARETKVKGRIKKIVDDSGSSTNAGLGMSGELLSAYAELGALKIAKGAVKFAEWSKDMLDDFGETIRPHLEKIWGESQKLHSEGIADDPTTTLDREPTVGGTGNTKESKLAKGVEEKAIKNQLATAFEGRPEYETVSVADQSKKAIDLVTSDLPKAIDIAMGKATAPQGLLPESVFVAVENYATEHKDVNLLRDLATTSSLSLEATGMGQRIRMLAERNPDSPVASIERVVKARQDAAVKRAGPKAVEKVKAQIKVKIKEANAKPKEWSAFIEGLKCT